MNKCSNCGLVLNKGDLFCPQCGTKVKENNNLEKWKVSDDIKKTAEISEIPLFKNASVEEEESLAQKNKDQEKIKKKKRKKAMSAKDVLLALPPVNINFNEEVSQQENADLANEQRLKIEKQKIEEQKKLETERKIEAQKQEEQRKKEEEEKRKQELIVNYKYDDDDIIYGDDSDLKEIEKKELERAKFSESTKSNKGGLKSILFNKTDSDNKNTNKTQNKKRGLFSSMFSGFADEEADEELKSEISKSKPTSNKKYSELKRTGEGRKKKKNKEDNKDREERSDKIEQTDKHEEDYDNYYEVVIPLDEFKYERKSSFKVHFIGFVIITVASLLVGVLIATSGFGGLLGQ